MFCTKVFSGCYIAVNCYREVTILNHLHVQLTSTFHTHSVIKHKYWSPSVYMKFSVYFSNEMMKYNSTGMYNPSVFAYFEVLFRILLGRAGEESQDTWYSDTRSGHQEENNLLTYVGLRC